LHGHEAAAAEVARRRIHHSQRVAHGDRRVDRVAAALEHVGADLGCEVLRADDHSVLGRNGRLRECMQLACAGQCKRRHDGATQV
jgi:hypothetical protein